jgi:hypothetical protein
MSLSLVVANIGIPNEESKWNRQKNEKSTLDVSKVDFLL